jgi:hypothetical protein
MDIEDYPFGILRTDGLHLIEGDQDPISDAIAELYVDFSESKILGLITSQNVNVSDVGLQILSELGSKSYAVIDAALVHVSHPSWEARFHLADCLLACHARLSSLQLSHSLQLASDEHAQVRCKEMELLSHFNRDQIREILASASHGDVEWALGSGMRIIDEKNNPNTLIQVFCGSEYSRDRCLAGSRLIRRARLGTLDVRLPSKCVSEAELDFLRWKVSMISKYGK